MKKSVKSTSAKRLETLSAIKQNSSAKLSQNEMCKIKGGDGEENSRGEIIIILKPR